MPQLQQQAELFFDTLLGNWQRDIMAKSVAIMRLLMSSRVPTIEIIRASVLLKVAVNSL